MADIWTGRSRLIRGLVAGGVLLQLVTWTMNIVLFPSAFVAVVAAVAGARSMERDGDDAVLRLGVAFLASLFTAALAMFSGVLVFVLVAWGSSGLLWLAWLRQRGLTTDRRRAWGIKQQDILRRRLELEDRQRQLGERREL